MKLAARFGAETALVIDLDAPVKTRIGYRILADFPRLEYADGALAHQMAAAPELLKALKDACDAMEGFCVSADSDDPCHEMLARWRATIAKAEGRS